MLWQCVRKQTLELLHIVFALAQLHMQPQRALHHQLYRLWGDGKLMLSVVTSGFLHCAFIFIRLVIACLFVCCIHTIPSFKTSHGSLQHFILLLFAWFSLLAHSRVGGGCWSGFCTPTISLTSSGNVFWINIARYHTLARLVFSLKHSLSCLCR